MIYVDDLHDWGWKYGKSCHLSTDDHSEAGIAYLHVFTDSIGVPDAWFQDRVRFPHYDLSARFRDKAIAAGAIALSCKELVRRCAKRREAVS